MPRAIADNTKSIMRPEFELVVRSVHAKSTENEDRIRELIATKSAIWCSGG
jgi:hypothetical protein